MCCVKLSAQLDLALTQSESICSSDGSISAVASDGTEPYQYRIISGPELRGFQTSGTFLALQPGTYSVEVTDATFATHSESITVLGNYTLPSLSLNITQQTCPSGTDGQVVLTGTNGNFIGTAAFPTFKYRIVDLSTTPQTVIQEQNSNTFSGLSEGMYTFQIEDGCQNTVSETVTLAAPPIVSLQGAIDFIEKVACDTYEVEYSPFGRGVSPHNVTVTEDATGTVVFSGSIDTSSGLSYSLGSNYEFGVDYTVDVIDACGQTDSMNFNSVPDLEMYSRKATDCSGDTNFFVYPSLTSTTSREDSILVPATLTITNQTDASDVVVYTITDPNDLEVIINQADITIGDTYNAVLEDSCNYLINRTLTFTNLPSVYFVANVREERGCMDGTTGMEFHVRNGGIQFNRTTITSGPASFTSEAGVVTNYSYPRVFDRANSSLYLEAFPPGSYTAEMTNGCETGTVNWEILPSETVEHDFSLDFLQSCGNLNSLIINPNVIKTSGTSFYTNVNVINVDTGVNIFRESIYFFTEGTPVTVPNLPTGDYHLFLEFQSGGNCSSSFAYTCPCEPQTVNVTIPEYVPISFEGIVGYTCTEGSGVIFAEGANGVAPYQYEIIDSSVPANIGRTSTDGIFDNTDEGTYTVRISDSCGNSADGAFEVKPYLPNLVAVCDPSGTRVTLSANPVQDAIFTWINDSGTTVQQGTSNELIFDPFDPSQGGDYILQISATGLSCTIYDGAITVPNIPCSSSIDVSKTVESGPIYNSATDQYSVTYRITAENIGGLAGSYDVIDTFILGTGFTLTNATLAYGGESDGVDGTILTPFTSGDQIITGESLAGLRTESWLVTAVFSLDTDLFDPTQDCTNGGGFGNQITVTGDTDTSNNMACVPVNIAEIELVKEGVYVDTDSNCLTNVGDEIVYTFTLLNRGNLPLSNVVVSDPLLGGVLLGPASGDTDGDGELDISETWVYNASFAFSQTDIDNGQVNNLATVNSEDPDGNLVTRTSTDPTPCSACTPDPTCPDCTLVYLPSNPDTDNDGIADICDLDDDNDGIYDRMEGCENTDLSGTVGIGNQIIDTTYPIAGTDLTYVVNKTASTSIYAFDTGLNGLSIRIDGQAGEAGSLTSTYSTPIENVFFKMTDFDNETQMTIEVYDHNNVLYDLTSEGIAFVGSGITQTGNSFAASTSNSDGDDPAGDATGAIYFYFEQPVSRVVLNFNHVVNSSTRFIQPTYCIADFDNDGIKNHKDLDSDADGIPDNVEAQTTIGYTPPNADNSATYLTNNGVNSAYLGGLTPTNTDTSDNPDYLDLDSDNEGGNDTAEANITLAGNDTDNDGLDDTTDATADYTDVGGTIDNPLNAPVQLPDLDLDAGSGGDVDFRDATDDSIDTDNDTIPDRVDMDDDNDGIPDIEECLGENPRMLTYDTASGQTITNDSHGLSVTSTGYPIIGVGPNGIAMEEDAPGHEFTFAEPVGRLSFTVGNVHPTNEIGDFQLTLADGTVISNADFSVTHDPVEDVFDFQSREDGGNPDYAIHLVKRVGAPYPAGIRYVRNGPGTGQSWGIILFEGYELNPIVKMSFTQLTGPNLGMSGGIAALRQVDCDTDGDGVFNHLDLDSDNDGILDAFEVGHGAAHTNGALNGAVGVDGIPDAVQAVIDDRAINYTFSESTDDTDTIYDFLDLDSDGDGIPDNVEAQTTIGYVAPSGSVDVNGVDTSYATGLVPTNTDGADAPDYLDLDSDNEGVNDTAEAQITLSTNDSDNDGLDDAIDADLAGYADPGGIIDDPLSGAVILIDSDNDANSGGDVDFRDSSDDRTDTDNDGLADAVDLDDDNDGLTDSEELSFIIGNGQPDCTGETTLDFSSVPTLVSGTALLEGAVYRFPNVASGIDALVTIDRTFNASVADIDNNSAEPQSFRPRTAFDIVNIGKKGFIEYRIQFVTTGLTTPVIIPKFLMNVNDTDGNVEYSEEIGMYDPSHYTLSNPTELTMTTDTPWLIATGGTNEYTGAGNTFPQVNFGTTYTSRSEIYVRTGISTIVPAAAASGREHNIDFRCTTNYINPVTYGIDIDGDGIGNHIDLDSDNDGIFDAVEAGHSQAHTNGVINGSVDTDGIPDAVQASPTSGTVNYTVAESADDADLSPNYLDLDSDGDGIPDNVEAQPTVGYNLPNNTYDANGVDTAYSLGLTPINTDGTDNPDYLDTDSDNEGANDTLEAAIVLSGNDIDNDGLDDATDEDLAGFADAGGTIDDAMSAPVILPDMDLDATSGGDVDYRDATDDRPDNDNDGIPNVVDLDDDNDGILDSDELACSGAISDFNSMWNFGTGNGADAAGSGTLNGVPYTLSFNLNGGSKLFSTTSQYTSNSTLGHGGNPGSLLIGGGSATGANGESLTLVFASEVDIIVGFDHINDLTNVNEGWLFDIPADEVISMDALNRIIGSGTIDGFELGQTGPLNTEVAYFLWNDVTSLTFTGQAETAATLGFNSINILCDTDNDGIPNHWDLDSDNDGILDAEESGHGLTHTNGILNGPVGADGVPDSAQSDPDGGLTNYTIAESADDIDTIPNFLDLDADGDGIPDNVEAQTTLGYITPNNVVDTNGVDTAYTIGLTPTNTDGTDNPDYLDTDSDNEGADDTAEAAIVLTGNDTDNDGLDDATDATADYTDVGGTIDNPLTVPVILPDSDNDATSGGDVDYRDAIDDRPDTDNDGVPDDIDLDDDNDGILDTVEGGLDPDSDLIINSLDLDSDNDGIPDNVEAQTTVGYTPPNADDAATYLANNGVNSAYLGGITPTNTDGTDNPDYLDTDSDNEGADDTAEATIVLSGNDTDNDGLDDATDATADYTDIGGTIDDPLTAPVILPDGDNDATSGGDVDFRDAVDDAPIDLDTDDDGILDSFEDLNADGDNDPATDPTNSDNDIYPDYLDIDSDNDGIPDNVEAQTTSGYVTPSLIDANNNGVDDAYETATAVGIIPVNTDGLDLPDFLDDDSDNDNVPDNIEGHDYNQDGIADVIFIGSDKDDDGLDDNYEGLEQIDLDVNDEIDDPINDLPNNDGDTESDYRDMDDDNDGVPTMGEDMNGDMDYSNDDWDNDGIPDYLDPDIQSDDELEVYNVITANGDGIHDVLTIRSIENYPNNNIQVYNRWGILVFETTSYNNESNSFDGSSQARATFGSGELLPIGTYFYILNYEDRDGSMKQLSGHLYLN